MPWGWKVKDIHHKIIEYMKDNILFDYTTGWSFQKEYMIMMRHVMSSERVFVESKLSQKAQQTLIIKKINQKLTQQHKKKSIMMANFDLQMQEVQDLKIIGLDRPRVIKFEDLTINLKQDCLEVFTMHENMQSQESDGQTNNDHLQMSTVSESKFKCIGFI